MQRMHDVGALFFLFAFPFPSNFRSPLSQKRTLLSKHVLFWPKALKRFPPNQQRRTHYGQPKSLLSAQMDSPAKLGLNSQINKEQPVTWQMAAETRGNFCEKPRLPDSWDTHKVYNYIYTRGVCAFACILLQSGNLARGDIDRNSS